MKTSPDDIRDALNAKLPQSMVQTRKGAGNQTLSYMAGWAVIDQLNQILGQGNWCYSVEEMRIVGEAPIDRRQQDGNTRMVFVANYIAKVKLRCKIENAVEFSDYGYGDGEDYFQPGKAHELAVKEAATDGLKRCARCLGMALGLALYDKSHSSVESGAQKPAGAAQGAQNGGNASEGTPKGNSAPALPPGAINNNSEPCPKCHAPAGKRHAKPCI